MRFGEARRAVHEHDDLHDPRNAVEVAAGLNPGDLVVRAGVHKLHAGQKVRVLAEAAK